MPNPHEVERLASLFGSELASLDPGLETDLKVVLRVVLQTHQELQRLGQDPAAALAADPSLHHDVDMLRDDIRSVLEFFEKIESWAAGLRGVQTVRWPWPEDISWSRLRAGFEVGLSKLGEADLALWQRFVQLVGLIRIELCFWGMTAGMTNSGFIR